MSNSNQLLPDWLLKAAEQAVTRQSDALRDAAERWQRGLKDSWQGNPPADAAEWARAASSSMETIGARTLEFAKAWWALNQDYFRDLNTLGSDFTRRSMDEWQRAGSDVRPGRRRTHAYTHNPPPAYEPIRQIPITLTGPVGGGAAQTFVLENPQDGSLSIGFRISEACDADGGPDFTLPLTIEPARFDLAPGDERAVTLRLSLPADRFIAGRGYTATVRVEGYPGLSLALQIQPTAPADDQPVKPHPRKEPLAEPQKKALSRNQAEPEKQAQPQKQTKTKSSDDKKTTSPRTSPRKPRTNG